MDNLHAARVFIGDSLGFHIIFALLGVGLPIVVGLIEYWGIRRGDQHLLRFARRLSQVMVLCAIAGVVSGTLIAIQLAVIWPGLIQFGDAIIGLPFLLEGYAFLLEAVFLAFYIATWQRWSQRRHVLLIIPVIIGAVGSAFFITLVNAWMNVPGGFDLVNGQLVNVDIWQGLLTPTAFFEITHSITSYLLATVLLVAGGLLWWLRSDQSKGDYIQSGYWLLRRLLIVALICEVVIAVIGHFSLQHLAVSQPRKFAAIERVAQTQTHAPYIFGGEFSEDERSIEGGLRIPHALSIMAGHSADTQIIGLNDFPRVDWPMLIVHELFELKMLFVGYLGLVPLLYLLALWRYPRWKNNHLLQWAVVACGPLAILVVELGWMITELGRQPYAVAGYLRTADAFIDSPSVLHWGWIFPILFVVLFLVTGVALKKILRRPLS